MLRIFGFQLDVRGRGIQMRLASGVRSTGLRRVGNIGPLALWRIRLENGQDMVEYALITMVISVAIILAATVVLSEKWVPWAKAILPFI